MAQILIVDDSATVRQQVRQALAPSGYEVVEADDGAAGLERLRAGGIALALCDVNMPRMTGIEMVAEMQKHQVSVPVIMLTTEAQPSLIRRAREHGARGWIVKPFRPDLLLMAVKNVLDPR